MAGMTIIPAMQFDLDRISKEIQLQGLNRSILARKARVSIAWVNRILNGQGNPSARVVKRLATKLGLDMRDLAIEEPKRRKAS